MQGFDSIPDDVIEKMIDDGYHILPPKINVKNYKINCLKYLRYMVRELN